MLNGQTINRRPPTIQKAREFLGGKTIPKRLNIIKKSQAKSIRPDNT